LERIHTLAERHKIPLLIEADGSRMKPVKAPAAHEPVIPPFVETVVVVAGLSALGQPLTPEWVHRPEIFANLSGLTPGERITPESLVRVLSHQRGGLKDIPEGARRLVLLNQADTPELQAVAGSMAGALLAGIAALSLLVNPNTSSTNITS
jgi:molybdenum cofactor cytidylyltransferase